MKKYRIVLQYVGTGYRGWQSQPGGPTIQATVQDAVERITRQRVSVVGAGRTDSGVHALGQVAHFRVATKLDSSRLRIALNSVLPRDIRIVRLRPAPAQFHAQRDAVRKRYDYRLYVGPVLSPFQYHQVLHFKRRLDPDLMSQAAGLVLGCHDFSGFAAAGTSVRTRERMIYESQILRRGYHLTYRIVGNGFLHHMVRNIVGTLLEIGSGRRPADDIRKIIRSRDRREAGPTAPAHGLYLVKVWYA